MRKKGFTLAEVLITLTIIGVVAAMTIPALIGNTDSLEMKTGYKKAVSILNQAVIMGLAKANLTPANCSGCTGAVTNTAGPTSIATFFRNYLNVASYSNEYFYTVDGIKYTFYKGTADACGTTLSTAGAFATTTSCFVLIDINGAKGSNTLATGNATTGATAYVFNDQYYAVVTGSNVIPASNTTNTAANAALYQ